MTFRGQIVRHHLLIRSLSICLLAPSMAFGGWFGPSTFEDCVLDKLNKALPGRQIQLVQDMCRKKLPLKDGECKARESAIRLDPACKSSVSELDIWNAKKAKASVWDQFAPDQKCYDRPPWDPSGPKQVPCDLPPQIPSYCKLPYGCKWPIE